MSQVNSQTMNALDETSFDAACSTTATTQESNLGGNSPQIQQQQRAKRLNKTEKKLQRYQKLVENYKLKKLEKKRAKQLNATTTTTTAAAASEMTTNERQENNQQKLGEEIEVEEKEKEEKRAKEHQTSGLFETFYNKRELKRIANQRLIDMYRNEYDACSNLKVIVDCSYSDKMANKELSRLAQQIGRCYALNKLYSKPVYLTVCNLDVESNFYRELCRMNDGFARYHLKTTNKSILELHAAVNMSSIVYLSPDAPELLEHLDEKTVYVIGGLVDETVSKKVTFDKCKELKIRTCSLPIEKYMKRKTCSSDLDQKLPRTYTYNKILTINQVFEILADYYENKDWPRALARGVPKRKGFFI
jgi:tRNA (guanine9-N1)-methyltransferase